MYFSLKILTFWKFIATHPLSHIKCFLSFIEKIESKFDDHVDEESDMESDHPSHNENDSGKYYLEDTPPESPVELKPDLPVYLPAIQGCRNVEEFHCLNRIEEGAYGVVYRARDKKTGKLVFLQYFTPDSIAGPCISGFSLILYPYHIIQIVSVTWLA